MPVFKSGYEKAPSWCEMEFFFIYRLAARTAMSFFTRAKKEKIFVCEGKCQIHTGTLKRPAKSGEAVDIREHSGSKIELAARKPAIVIRIGGRWGEEAGHFGFFQIENNEQPKNEGDPVEYPHRTVFDNHYHDCDQYWIVYRGKAIAVSEGKLYTISAGDCLVTGQGHHHDLPEVIDPISGIYFETTLLGSKRTGHLWDHKNGRANPANGKT